MTTLHDRLAELAEESPPSGPAPDLWDRGVRRHHKRRIAALAAVVAAVALIGGTGAAVRLQSDPRPTPPVDVPFGELHLPRHVYPPSPWAEGTDELGPPGPLAAVGIAERNQRQGLTGKTTVGALYGVSAVDGSVRFLDLQGPRAGAPIFGLWYTVSPDGTKVGYVRGRGDSIVGWAVYDTTTGETTELSDPRVQQLTNQPVGFDLGFSGDSRYLQTDYSWSGSTEGEDLEMVVWDVTSEERYTAEGAGHHFLPNMGSGPHGIVWARGRQIFTFDPETGSTTARDVPRKVVWASYGPDGQDLAYIADGATPDADWQLHAGGRVLELASDNFYLDRLAGWRDADHLVVQGAQEQGHQIVDVRTGAAERVATPGAYEGISVASDLWANDLVDGVRPPTAQDPRPSRGQLALGVGGMVVLLAGLAGILVRRRRVGA